MSLQRGLPYLIALFVAGMMIAGGWLFVGWTHKGMQQRFETFKAGLLEMKKTGTLPAEWQKRDLENLKPSQVQMKIPAEAQTYLEIADWLTANSTALMLGALALGSFSGWMFNRRYARNHTEQAMAR